MYRTHRPRSYALLLAGLLAIMSMVPLALHDQEDVRAAAPSPPTIVLGPFFNTLPVVPYYTVNVTVAVTYGSVLDMRTTCIDDLNNSSLADPAPDCAPNAAAFTNTVARSLVISDEGSHTVATFGCDYPTVPPGGCSAPTSDSFFLDKTLPTATWSSPAANTNANPSFAFSAVDPLGANSTTGSGIDTVQCRVDAGAFAPCGSSPFQPGPLTAGAHTVYIRSTDNAGNVSVIATHNFTVDDVAPDTAITSGVTGLTSSSGPLAFNIATPDFDVDYFECRITFNGVPGAWGACDGSVDNGLTVTSDVFTIPATVAEGAYIVEARAIDLVDNIDATPASRSFTVDRTAPDTTFTGGTAFSGAAGANVGTFYTNSTGPLTFNLAGTDPNAPNSAGVDWFECSFDSAVGPWTPCSGNPGGAGSNVSATTHTVAGPVSQGLHTLYASAIDALGHVDASRATYDIFVDTVKPNSSIPSGPAAYVNILGPFNFTLSATDAAPSSGVDYFECRLDGGAWLLCSGGGINDNTVTNPGTHTIAGPLGLGCHTLEVRAEDRAGNLEDTPASHTWCIDTTPPVVNVTATQKLWTGPAYAFGTWVKENVYVHFSCAEDTSDANYDSGIATNTYPTSPIGFISDGVYTVNFVPPRACVDKAGNAAAGTTPSLPQTVKTDQTPPVCSVLASPNRIARTGSVNSVISATESDKTSGVASVVLKRIYLNSTGLDTSSGPASGPQYFSYVAGSNIGGSLNGATTGTFKFFGAKGRSWTIEVLATDVAGNTQLCKTKVTSR